jgi:(1->4)-alpha-D-glucan 1-alpha-D-glucosylmutase
VTAAAEHALVHVVDFVPNHMGIGTGTNAWWNDVLENGPSSPTATFFDVDWAPVKQELHAKLLLPILGDQYGQVLERGELQLIFRDGTLGLALLRSRSCRSIPVRRHAVYRAAVERLAGAARTRTIPSCTSCLSIITSLENLPPYTDTDPQRVECGSERRRWRAGRLSRLGRRVRASGGPSQRRSCSSKASPAAPTRSTRCTSSWSRSRTALAHWRTASHEINYRRFFDVNTLVGLRVEDARVFEETHQLLASLIAENKVQAVRIAHPGRLVRSGPVFLDVAGSGGAGLEHPTGTGARGPADRPLYVLAEKILSGRELLPRRWTVTAPRATTT